VRGAAGAVTEQKNQEQQEDRILKVLFEDWLNDLEKKIFVFSQGMAAASPAELSIKLNLPVETVVIILRKMAAEGKIDPGKSGGAKDQNN
jgi:hypothetical protein